MFHSLYSKLAVVLLGLFSVVGAFVVGVTFFSTDMYQQEINQKLNRDLARSIVAEKLLMEDSRISDEALQSLPQGRDFTDFARG